MPRVILVAALIQRREARRELIPLLLVREAGGQNLLEVCIRHAPIPGICQCTNRRAIFILGGVFGGRARRVSREGVRTPGGHYTEYERGGGKSQGEHTGGRYHGVDAWGVGGHIAGQLVAERTIKAFIWGLIKNKY